MHSLKWQGYQSGIITFYLKRFRLIITSTSRVGSSKNGSTSIKSGLYSCFCDTNGLLLHGLMNCNLQSIQLLDTSQCMAKGYQEKYYAYYLISDIHLVKFINAANAIVGKHQSTSLETSSLLYQKT